MLSYEFSSVNHPHTDRRKTKHQIWRLHRNLFHHKGIRDPFPKFVTPCKNIMTGDRNNCKIYFKIRLEQMVFNLESALETCNSARFCLHSPSLSLCFDYVRCQQILSHSCNCGRLLSRRHFNEMAMWQLYFTAWAHLGLRPGVSWLAIICLSGNFLGLFNKIVMKTVFVLLHNVTKVV